MNIKLRHSVNGSNVWGSLAPYGDVATPLVQMEYLQDKEYFPFKTVIIDDSLQITLGKKNNCQVSFGIFFISLFVQLPVLFSTSWS